MVNCTCPYLCNWCVLVDRTKNTKTEPKRYLCETAMSCSEWVRTTISKLLSLNALCFIIFETLLASWWNRGWCYENILRKGYVDTPLLLLLSLVLILLLLLLLLLPTTIIIFIIMVHAGHGRYVNAGNFSPIIYIRSQKAATATLPRILVDPGKTVPWSAPSLFQHLCFSGRPSVSSE